MTIAMADSITPGNMPMGYPAYLGYADGKWPTAARLPALFPGAKVVSLTVFGTLDADGIDIEPGNPTAKEGAVWVKNKLAAAPASRPVAYASMGGQPGYGMPDVISALLTLGIGRSRYRVLTAHYTGQAHICSPATCRDSDGRPIGFTADGTQWTSNFPGVNGAPIDMSLLADDFFGAPAPVNWTEKIMQELPLVKQGAAGEVVRTVQGLCCARGRAVAVDGVFGPATLAAVKAVQTAARATVDGIVGPVTWGKLLGV